MNEACHWRGYELCEDEYTPKQCDEAEDCDYGDIYDYFSYYEECLPEYGCPLNQYYELCDNCKTELNEVTGDNACPIANLEAWIKETPKCAECARFFLAKITETNAGQPPLAWLTSCRGSCTDILKQPNGRCTITKTTPFTELCDSDPVCNFCFTATARTCPPATSKGNLSPQCAPGCSVEQLGNGACEEACLTPACRYDFDDCKIAQCSPGCSWGDVGNGLCDTACVNEACLSDMGDCLNLEPCKCNQDFIGDQFCDESCFNAECRWDGGDCFCAVDCATPLLYNEECDTGCNTLACNYDWGVCDCSEGCNIDLLSNGYCDEECNNAECDYDAGVCWNTTTTEKYTEYSLYQIIFYNQSEWAENIEECPDLKPIEEDLKVYDNEEYDARKEKTKKEILNNPGWEFSGEVKYFERCYSSYYWGYYVARFEDYPERTRVLVDFRCNPDCSECEKSFADLENDQCSTRSAADDDYALRIKWEVHDSSTMTTVSLLLGTLFLLFNLL